MSSLFYQKSPGRQLRGWSTHESWISCSLNMIDFIYFNFFAVEETTGQCDDQEASSTPGGGKPAARRTTSIGQQPKGTLPYVVSIGPPN